MLQRSRFAVGAQHRLPFGNTLAGPVQRFAAAMRSPMKRLTSMCAGMNGFSDASLDRSMVGIMGDLHLAPEQMHLFNQARQQLVAAMTTEEAQLLPGARVVQLGDLGHAKHGSGGNECFKFAKAFIDGFPVPTAMVLGNHDLEGEDFETDEENLEAWKQAFQQPHHWSADLGHVLAVGLSTVRYRSNVYSHHEVYIDEAQLEWLEAELVKSNGRPVVIFTHAPPIGCGLKVVQNVHIKNRCAWLNHSDRPERFAQLVERHPNIRLWFSGHFHLSHNYPDSISVVGRTAYVQTGVIGECNRDGNRHSRVLVTSSEGYEVHTMDHDTGALRLDLKARWADEAPPQPMLPPEEELLCDPSAGWLCSKAGSPLGFGQSNEFITWFPVGDRVILGLQDELLVEYDLSTRSPIGLVCKVPSGSEVLLRDAEGRPASSADGSDVASVTVTNSCTGPQTFVRNQEGGFYQIYMHNKWRAKKEAAKAAAAEAERMEELAAAASRQG